MRAGLPYAFAKAIKALRLRHDLSQEELAEKSGLDRTYISGIEREARNPTIKSIQKIIIALEASDKDFLDLVKDYIDE